MAPRRLLAPLALLLLAWTGTAQALDERAALRLLNPRGVPGTEPPCSAVAPWGPPGGGTFVVAVPDDDQIRVAVMRESAEGQPVIVAGPTAFEPMTLDPLWACLINVVEQAPIGGRAVIALRVSNSYTSTGRSSSTEARHLLLPDGPGIRPIFATLISARHSEEAARGRRTGWTRRYRLVMLPSRTGAMPEIEIRDIPAGRVVSRHRWRGDAYAPPVFDRFPPVGPG